MKHALTYYGNPILRKKAERVDEITDEIRELVQEMIELMKKHNGIGLAAPQAGVSKRLFIVSVPREDEEGEWIPGKLMIFINPTIESIDEKREQDQEGCLSMPGIYGKVERPTNVTIKALDLDGHEFTVSLEGLEARCALHENDHINGVLFIDRMNKKDRMSLEKKLKELKKKHKS